MSESREEEVKVGEGEGIHDVAAAQTSETVAAALKEAEKAQKDRKKRRLRQFSVKNFISKGKNLLQKIKGEIVGGTHVSEEERFEAAHAFLKHYLAHWEVLETHKEAAVEKGKAIDEELKAARKAIGNGAQVLEDLEAALRQYLPKLVQLSQQIQEQVREAEFKVEVISSKIKEISEQRAKNYQQNLEMGRNKAIEKYKDEKRAYIRSVEVEVRQEAERRKKEAQLKEQDNQPTSAVADAEASEDVPGVKEDGQTSEQTTEEDDRDQGDE